MKRLGCVFLCLCLALTMLSTGIVTAFAEGTAIADTEVLWSFDEETGVLSFDGTGAIPDYDTYKDEYDAIDTVYPWSDVAYTSIVFGEGITGIGNYAFCYSPMLESVVIPETVTSFGTGIFFGCDALTSATVLSAEVGASMFSLCGSLENVTLGEAVQTIGTKAFYRCNSLETIALPASVKTINESAFEYCTKLTSIAVPEGATTVGERVFYHCDALVEVTLPTTLETLGVSAFDSCRALKSITIPELITTIPADLCSGCRALEEVTLPSGVRVIEEGAFALCDALKSITIPASINVIADGSVGYGKWSLPVADFTIHGYLNSPAFTYAQNNKFNFVSLGLITSGSCGEDVTWEYDEATKTLTFSGTGAMEDFSKDALIPYNCIPYETVVIADTITRIGAYAFYNSPAVDFALGNNITEIAEKAIGYYVDDNGADAVNAAVSITAYEETAAHEYATANGVTFNSLGKFIVTEGKLGEEISWTYDKETKTLTVSGTGATHSYSPEAPAAFAEYEIESIIVEDGITELGDYALYTLAPYGKITLGKDVMTIGKKSFGFVKTEKLDEELNPTGEYEIVADEELEVTGYIATPADEYAREFGFTFVPLDAEICQNFHLGAKSTIDHINKYIYLYVKSPDVETVFGTIDEEQFDAVLPEKVATGALLSLTDAIGTMEYKLIVYGDVNRDSQTNAVDSLAVLMCAVELMELDESQLLAADIDKNGRINSMDALAILQLNVGVIDIANLYNPGKIK